jgi:Tol biopolymer transport system component
MGGEEGLPKYSFKDEDQQRLDTWGEIAKYLCRSVRTVQRWEYEEALPVRRHRHADRDSVYAFRHELDAWRLARGMGTGTRDSTQGHNQESDFQNSGGAQAQTPIATGNSRVRRIQRQATRFGLGLVAAAIFAVLAYYLARPLPAPHVLAYTQITNDGRTKPGNLVTDGAKLYFVERLPARNAILQVPASGGDAQPLSDFFRNPRILDLNLSRAEILVADPVETPGLRPSLWALPLAGGQPRRVGNLSADAAAWSRDGNSIAYAVGPDLYISGSDGAESRKIASVEGVTIYIRWSPDGKRLRFTVYPVGRGIASIWEVEADGSRFHRLFADSGGSESTAGGVWTRDGAYFLFAQGRELPGDLWALSERTGIPGLGRRGPVQLTRGPLRVGGYAASPDGRKLFIVGLESRNELLRFDVASKGFVPYLAGVSADEVDFSRDGRWIAYVDGPDGNLWRRRADGNEPLRLTSPSMGVELPRWSPDGKQIAFMGEKTPESLWQVFLVPAEGGKPQPVLPAPYPQGAPTWSADGTQLAFGELHGGTVRMATELAIHVVNLRTHKASTLPGSAGLWTARWSPDGRHLAALTADSRSLLVFDFSRARWEKVATAGSISDLNWSRNGDWIYFEDRIPPQGPAVFRVRLGDRRVELVASLKREPPVSSSWLGLAPDGSLLVSNALDRSEIYALDWDAP